MNFLKTILICTILISLTGCFNKIDEVSYTTMELNSIYLNQHDEKYRDLFIDSDITLFEENYYEGVAFEVEFLIYYVDAIEEDLKEETIKRAEEIYDRIYKYSKYEVSKNGDKVEVKIYPIDIINKTVNDISVLSQLFTDATTESTDGNIEDLYFNKVLDTIEAQIGEIGYLEPITIDFELGITNGYYEITEEDMQEIDTYIISYE